MIVSIELLLELVKLGTSVYHRIEAARGVDVSKLTDLQIIERIKGLVIHSPDDILGVKP